VGAQPGRQVAVELDHRQVPQTLDQGLSQCGQAGPDFHHGLPRPGINGADDGIDDAAVGQEMLAEALARNVFHQAAARPPQAGRAPLGG
jgi:hypothetical protein